MRIGLKYITPMLAAGAAAVAIGAAPISRGRSRPAGDDRRGPPWRRPAGAGGGWQPAADGAAAAGMAAAGAVVGGLGSIPGAGADKRPITR